MRPVPAPISRSLSAQDESWRHYQRGGKGLNNFALGMLHKRSRIYRLFRSEDRRIPRSSAQPLTDLGASPFFMATSGTYVKAPPLSSLLAMWRFTRNNGITEGFHNKMQLINRQAYGFRNFQNYRLRVKVLCS
jgi:hypothetical protein